MNTVDESLADIIFQRSRRQQLTAETLIGPIIAGLVSLTSTTGIQGAVLTWAMAFLFIIPAARYLVYTDKIAPFDEFLNYTVRPIEFCSILGLVQLFKFISETVVTPLVSISVIEGTIVVTTIATIVYVLGFELIFKKYRFSWGTLFYFKCVEIENSIGISLKDTEAVFRTITAPKSAWGQLRAGLNYLKITFVRVAWGQTAFHLLKDSIPERNDDLVESLTAFVEENKKKQSNQRAGFWFTVAVSSVVLPVLAAMAWILSLVFATPLGQIILALGIMRLTKHIVGLSYIAFGTMDYNQFISKTNTRWLVLMTFYTSAIYLIFF